MAALSTDLFDYALPEERIAQRPPAARDGSRLLHLPPQGPPEDRRFTELPDLLRPGDLLVGNDTRVRAARLRGSRPGGGPAELLVLNEGGEGEYVCLVRPARRLPPGTRVALGGGLIGVVGGTAGGHPGARRVRFEGGGKAGTEAAIEAAGSTPLPPYIRVELDDPERYQTVFAASPPRSAAAPTAGLHFTAAGLDRLRARGVELATVRLEVGLATFTPIRTATIDEHRIHEERFELPTATAEAIAAARRRGGRVIAIGTTTTRVLETMAAPGGTVDAGSGVTRLYLRPGAPIRVIDGLLTNFHQPRSSLLVLIAAVFGAERWRAAYDHALAAGYRFLSFGDCMLGWTAAPSR